MRQIRRSPLTLSLLSCAIAAAAAGASPVALAVDLCAGNSTTTVSTAHPADSCNLNQNDATLTVASTGSIGLGVDVNADGVSLNNAGSISGAQTALHFLGSHAIVALTNSGTVSVDGGTQAYGLHSNGTVDLAGMLLNTGRIQATASTSAAGASAYGIAIADNIAGVLDNRGSITAEAGGSYARANGVYVTHDVTGSLLNSGTVAATAQDTGAGNAIVGGLYLLGLSGTGNVTNSGTISATGHAESDVIAHGLEIADVRGAASLSNSGTLAASATVGTGTAMATGLLIGSFSGTAVITNSGTVSSTVSAPTGNGLGMGVRTGAMFESARLANSGNVVVDVVGAGASDQAYGLYVTSLGDSASIANSGRLSVTMRDDNGYAYGIGAYVQGNLSGTSRIDNTGTISVASSGDSGAASGLWVASTVDTGTVVANSGRVQASATGNSASAYAYGWSAGTVKGQLVNDGVLDVSATGATDVTADAMWMYTGAGGTYANTGTIVATGNAGGFAVAQGMWNWNATLGTTISNSGTIHAVANGGTGASAFGIYTNSLDAASSLTNTGTVSATATADSTARAYGLYASLLNGTVSNSGTIDVSATGTATSAYGIVANGGIGSVVNSGSISGGVTLGGTVSLSNDGTLVNRASNASLVGGNYTQGADGLLVMQVQDAGHYATLNVGGTADFTAGDHLNVTVTPDVMLVNGSTLAGVVSAGTLTTDLDGITVTDSSLFWNFTGVRNGNALDLDVSFAGAAVGLAGAGQPFTPSQLAFADTVLQGGYGNDYSALAAAMNGAPTAVAAADALESVAPGLPGAAAAAARLASDGASRAISARLGEQRGAASGDAAGRNALWIKPFFGKGTQDSVSGVDGYDVDATGFVIGIDGDVSESWRLGVAVASADGSVDGEKTDLDVSSTQLTVYGRYAISDTAALDLQVDEAVNGIDSTRRVALAGSTARASFDGAQFALGATVSNRIAMGERGAFIPSLQARYQRIGLDGYTETGAGVYDLVVNSSTENSLLWAAQGAFEYGLGGGTLLANLGAGYDTRDAASLTSTLNGGTGPGFISFGNPVESTVLTGGLGYRYVTARNVAIDAMYDIESRGDYEAQTASVKVRLLF